MSSLTRKNLIVDDAKLKSLANRRGLSESATVRELVDLAFVADEIGDVFRELQRRGGVDDVFGRLPAPERQSVKGTRPARAGTRRATARP